jgi:hypothetical protein
MDDAKVVRPLRLYLLDCPTTTTKPIANITSLFSLSSQIDADCGSLSRNESRRRRSAAVDSGPASKANQIRSDVGPRSATYVLVQLQQQQQPFNALNLLLPRGACITVHRGSPAVSRTPSEGSAVCCLAVINSKHIQLTLKSPFIRALCACRMRSEQRCDGSKFRRLRALYRTLASIERTRAVWCRLFVVHKN